MEQHQEGEPIIEQGMKWHNFLIYFSLWAGSLLNLLNGLAMLTGYVYGNDAQAFYAYWGKGLQIVDIIMGMLSIVCAFYGIYVRSQLKDFRTGAPQRLINLSVITLTISIGYQVCASAATGVSLASLIDASTVSSIVTALVMIFVNKTYYDKRKHLFVN